MADAMAPSPAFALAKEMGIAMVREALERKASPKQLAAVAASCIRAAVGVESPSLSTETRKRGGTLTAAVMVQEALAKAGHQHHNLGVALQAAKQAGDLPAPAAQAGRRRKSGEAFAVAAPVRHPDRG